MEAARLRAYLVDDEPLAIERLQRMLARYGALDIVGSSTDPAKAVDDLTKAAAAGPGKSIDVLFLDIQMPGMNGFELLARLEVQPFVIFTTAYDQYALRAFDVNSIDYLVKPIETEQLERALAKLGRLRPLVKPDWQQSSDLPAVLQDLAASLVASTRSILAALPPASAIASPSSISPPSHILSRATSSPTPSSTAASTASTRPLPRLKRGLIPVASCAFIEPFCSTSTGSARRMSPSLDIPSFRLRMPGLRSFPSPATACACSARAWGSETVAGFALARGLATPQTCGASLCHRR